MSIQLIVNANSFPELAALLAGFNLGAPAAIEAPAEQPVQAEEVTPVRKPRGRPAKNQVIEGTLAEKAAGHMAGTDLSTQDTATAMAAVIAAEAEVEAIVEATSPVPEMTHDELRSEIIAWTNEVAAASPKDKDAKRNAFAKLREKFGFARVDEVDPAKFGGILKYLDDNKS